MNSIVKPIFNESLCEKKRFVGPVNSAQDPLISTIHRLFCWSRGSGSRAQCTGPTDRRDGAFLNVVKKKLKTQLPKRSCYPNAA